MPSVAVSKSAPIHRSRRQLVVAGRLVAGRSEVYRPGFLDRASVSAIVRAGTCVAAATCGIDAVAIVDLFDAFIDAAGPYISQAWSLNGQFRHFWNR
jgi:hypothetical protein